MNQTEYRYDWASGEQARERIYEFLVSVDWNMIPRLSDRVDIGKYAMKLAQRADNLFVVKENQDVASCSIYCDEETAFISSIAVRADFLHQHIGTQMMDAVKGHARARGCKRIRLEVDRSNAAAVRFYLRCGFGRWNEHENWFTMEFILEEPVLGILEEI